MTPPAADIGTVQWPSYELYIPKQYAFPEIREGAIWVFEKSMTKEERNARKPLETQTQTQTDREVGNGQPAQD